MVVSHAPTTGDLACIPGLCPDWELNQCPFGSQASTQPTKPHWPGRSMILCYSSPKRVIDLYESLLTNISICIHLYLYQARNEFIYVSATPTQYHMDHSKLFSLLVSDFPGLPWETWFSLAAIWFFNFSLYV